MQFDRVSSVMALCLTLALWAAPGGAQAASGGERAAEVVQTQPSPAGALRGTPSDRVDAPSAAHEPLAMLGVLAGLLAMAALERRLGRPFRPRPASS